MDIKDINISQRKLKVVIGEQQLKDMILNMMADQKKVKLSDPGVETNCYISHNGLEYIVHAEIICNLKPGNKPDKPGTIGE